MENMRSDLAGRSMSLWHLLGRYFNSLQPPFPLLVGHSEVSRFALTHCSPVKFILASGHSNDAN